MPEYLAPGVYVEETSFRARSIQGVGTSTTGFIGVTRKGPLGEAPQLVTSFEEYARVYGGLADLALSAPADADPVSYLAYAAYSFFREGGTRLYIDRVFQAASAGDGRAGANLIGARADASPSRDPRALSGIRRAGRLVFSENAQPATTTALDRAPVGTLARSRGTPALPAMLDATLPPAALTNGAQFQLAVNGAAATNVTINATPAEATGQDPIANTVTIPAGTSIRVTVNGTARVLGIAAGNDRPRADLITEIDNGLDQATATLNAANRLVITSKHAADWSLSMSSRSLCSALRRGCTQKARASAAWTRSRRPTSTRFLRPPVRRCRSRRAREPGAWNQQPAACDRAGRSRRKPCDHRHGGGASGARFPG